MIARSVMIRSTHAPVGVLHHHDDSHPREVEVGQVLVSVVVRQVATRRDLKCAEDGDVGVIGVERVLTRVSTRAESASLEVKNQLGMLSPHP
jgi:hypothetical protein